MLNPLLENLGEDVMGFLNEIQIRYPQASSLASGRPDERYFDLQDFSVYFNIFVDAVAEGKNRETVVNNLGQYNLTKGIVNELIAKYLKEDDQIDADPAAIVVTVGTQEAILIAVITLCDRENDVILVEDPAYVGITHFSIITGYKIDAAPVHLDGIDLKILEEKILSYRRSGKKVKIVYVIPDFHNPTGNKMSLEKRRQLLLLADQYGFYILEDNAYGDYVYDGIKPLSIKSMDTNKRVIYLRSFSKTLFPSLRLGAMVADQVICHGGKDVILSDLLAKTKGYTTVNTPAVNQAILGGILIKNNFSLKNVNLEKVAAIKEKRDLMVSSLNRSLGQGEFSWTKEISWNIPEGGFFITVRVPFKVDKTDVIFCAENYHVIFTPMSFFYLHEGGDNEIRLAFSHISPDQIVPAIERLAAYFKNRLNIND